jgi:hypothetical protein
MALGFRGKRSFLIASFALLVFFITSVSAKSKAVSQLSVHEIEEELQVHGSVGRLKLETNIS